jgi:hypothetical protein
MSFTRVIGKQPPTDQAIQIECPLLEQPATGWDMLQEKFWVPHPYWFKRGDIREGPAPEGGTFVVQDSRVTGYKAGRPIVEVSSIGIALQDGKDYKLEGSGSISEDLSLASGDAGFPTIWRKAYPRVTKLWVSLTTPSIYGHVGIAYAPPETFGISNHSWYMTWVDATDWTASGWMGESRVPQQLPGSKACLVTDTWIYDPGNEDRDGVPGHIIYL